VPGHVSPAYDSLQVSAMQHFCILICSHTKRDHTNAISRSPLLPFVRSSCELVVACDARLSSLAPLPGLEFHNEPGACPSDWAASLEYTRLRARQGTILHLETTRVLDEQDHHITKYSCETYRLTHAQKLVKHSPGGTPLPQDRKQIVERGAAVSSLFIIYIYYNTRSQQLKLDSQSISLKKITTK
jgi:hypothetical protein